jgi:hypothetical protein
MVTGRRHVEAERRQVVCVGGKAKAFSAEELGGTMP